MMNARKIAILILALFYINILCGFDNSCKVFATGNSYYVSVNGNDNNNGLSVNSPFKTIQKAASVMTAGDNCYIRGGTYRETVIPSNSGTDSNLITFQNYNNEIVTVNGSNTVSNWTQYSGNIYQADVNMSLGDGNQIFVDGNMMIEARWPNTGLNLLQPTLEVTDNGTNVSITDSSLTQPDGYWIGAKIWILSGLEWIAVTRTVTGYNQSTNTISFNAIGSNSSSDAYKPKAGNRYYLCGKFSELNSENEWYYDGAVNKLYLWAPGGVNPNTLNVEAKNRSSGFDLSNKSYINIIGINTFACTITSNSNTSRCVMDNINMKYISHQFQNGADGIALNGSYMELKNSIIDTAFSNAVEINGTYNRLVNCEIKNGGYGGTWEPLVSVLGSNQLVSHNTMYNSGRDGMGITSKQSQIQYNDVYNVGYLQIDMGILHFGNSEGDGTRIHHNWFHDGIAEGIMCGIYLDNIDNNYIIDHNVVWNCPEGIRLNTPCRYALVYNNTFYGTGSNGNLYYWGALVDKDDLYGCRAYNNIFTGSTNLTGGMAIGNNIYSGTSPRFVDAASQNFNLQSTSPAIDAGIHIPGITEGYSGNAPDCGAYEYGDGGWIAGRNFDAPPTVSYTVPSGIEYMNLLSNGGFESSLAGWSKTDSKNAALGYGDPWNSEVSNSKTQAKSVRLSGNIDGVERTVTNLQPNTTYTFSVWVKVEGDEIIEIGANNFGGQNVSDNSNQTIWKQLSVNFTTGSNNNSATVYIKKTSSGSGYVYADLTGVQKFDPKMSGDSFENGLSLWQGDGTVSNTLSHSGNSSYSVSDGNKIYQNLGSIYSKIVSLWVYDDASNTNLQAMARVDEGNVTTDNSWRGMGINTSVSSSNYCYRIGVNYNISSVPRQTGWHELKWDYTNGGRLDMYIDDILINKITGVKGFSNIAMGDWQIDGTSAAAYFDDLAVNDLNYDEGGFDHSYAGWTTAQKPNVTLSYSHDGKQSYNVNEDIDYISKKFIENQNNIVSVWFYDDKSDTSAKCMARVDNGIEMRCLGVDTSISAGNFVINTGGTSVPTIIQRETGWHELIWDYRSGTGVTMYIDNAKIGSFTGLTTYNNVSMGDFWSDGITGINCFDDVSFKDIDSRLDSPVLFADGFENNLGIWKATTGSLNYSTLQKRSGNSSYIMDEDAETVQITLPVRYYGKIVKMWMYDNASDTTVSSMARVDSNSELRSMGVNSGNSKGYYVCRIDNSSSITNVPRSTGWHELKWDYSSSVDVKLYIDNVLVRTASTQGYFDRITFFDWWADNTVGPIYFDDVLISNDGYELNSIYFDKVRFSKLGSNGIKYDISDSPLSSGQIEVSLEIWNQDVAGLYGKLIVGVYDKSNYLSSLKTSDLTLEHGNNKASILTDVPEKANEYELRVMIINDFNSITPFIKKVIK